MAIFFVATAYLAAGIFLAPLIAGREPRGQGLLSALLLGALAVVVFGSLGGEYLSYHGLLPRGLRSFFGAQGGSTWSSAGSGCTCSSSGWCSGW